MGLMATHPSHPSPSILLLFAATATAQNSSISILGHSNFYLSCCYFSPSSPTAVGSLTSFVGCSPYLKSMKKLEPLFFLLLQTGDCGTADYNCWSTPNLNFDLSENWPPLNLIYLHNCLQY